MSRVKIVSCFKFEAYLVSEYQKLYQNVLIPHLFIQGLLMFPIIIQIVGLN